MVVWLSVALDDADDEVAGLRQGAGESPGCLIIINGPCFARALLVPPIRIMGTTVKCAFSILYAATCSSGRSNLRLAASPTRL